MRLSHIARSTRNRVIEGRFSQYLTIDFILKIGVDLLFNMYVLANGRVEKQETFVPRLSTLFLLDKPKCVHQRTPTLTCSW